MKKFLLLSVVASTMIFGGGDIAPVEPEVVTPAPVPEVSNPIKFYIGGGYSRVNVDGQGGGGVNNGSNSVPVAPEFSIDGDNYLLLAGVKFNEYIALEGRYLNSFRDARLKNHESGNVGVFFTGGTLPDGEIESYGIYAKPMYPVTEKVDIYGLLGYANVKISDIGGKFMDDGDFSWGAGASYKVTDRLGIFADFVRLYDDTTYSEVFMGDTKFRVDSINVGLTYTF